MRTLLAVLALLVIVASGCSELFGPDFDGDYELVKVGVSPVPARIHANPLTVAESGHLIIEGETFAVTKAIYISDSPGEIDRDTIHDGGVFRRRGDSIEFRRDAVAQSTARLRGDTLIETHTVFTYPENGAICYWVRR